MRGVGRGYPHRLKAEPLWAEVMAMPFVLTRFFEKLGDPGCRSLIDREVGRAWSAPLIEVTRSGAVSVLSIFPGSVDVASGPQSCYYGRTVVTDNRVGASSATNVSGWET